MNKKIFILGSDGMLGRYLYKYMSEIYDICQINRNKYDVLKDNFNELKKILIPNTILINCIGIIPQKNEKENKTYIKINSIFPNMLSVLCDELDIKFIHITTDCVFSGKKGNYIESDIHDEINIYGLSKSLGEPNNITVIRTSIIGEELKSKKSLLEWVKSNNYKEIDGYIDYYWNGVTCLQLAKIINHIIKNDLYWKGVKHFFSPVTVSKYELIVLIILIYKLNIKVNKCKNIFTNKTLYTNHIIDLYNYKIPELKEQIEELYHFDIT